MFVPVLTLGASLPRPKACQGLRLNLTSSPGPGAASFTGVDAARVSGKERGGEQNPPIEKQINYSIYTKFATIAGESAEADLYVVFHLISAQRFLRAAIHTSSLNPI